MVGAPQEVHQLEKAYTLYITGGPEARLNRSFASSSNVLIRLPGRRLDADPHVYDAAPLDQIVGNLPSRISLAALTVRRS
jgi:hypothetical protein